MNNHETAEAESPIDQTEGQEEVKDALARHAVLETTGGKEAEQTTESTRTVDEMLEILDRGDSNEQLTSHDAHVLIDVGWGWSVSVNLNKFTGLDVSVAHKLIDTGRGEVVANMANNLDKFTGLDTGVAHKLIDTGWARSVASNLDKFIGIDHNKIAHKLIDTGWDWSVVSNLDRFTGLDVSVAHKLIDVGKAWSVVSNLDRFTGLDHNEIAHKLIDAGHGSSVARNLDKFTGLDHNEIAHKLIDADWGDSVADNLDKFTGLDASVAHKLIDAGCGLEVVLRRASFANPDEVIGILINMKRMDILIDAKYKDTGVDIGVNITILDYADNSYTYLSGGFSRKTIGELIKSRMDNRIERSIHDASQWLESFQMPDEWVDIDAIKAHEEQMIDPDEYRVRLKDAGVEARFILQLLDANLDLRKRLTYGTTPTFSDYDKLAILFTEERYKPLRGEFNARIGRGRRELTEQYYQELLADSAISQEWQTYQANSDKPQKKFFQKYLRSHPELAAELDRRATELQIKVEAELLAATTVDDPSAQELINSRISKGGEDWFYYPEYQLLYQAACSDDGGAQLYKSEDFSLDRLFGRAHDLVDSYYDSSFGKSKDETTHKLTKEELVQKLNRAFENLTANLDTIQSTPTWDDEAADADWKAQLAAVARNMGIKKPRPGLSDTVGELKLMSRYRKRYIQDTQAWLKRHTLAQSGYLTQAWGDRVLAIAEGVPDRASAIHAWQKLKGFQIRLDMAESSGELQDMGLSREYINSRPWYVAELTRKLSAKGALRAISKIKRWTEGTTWGHKLLPAATARIELDNRPYSMDIFGKDDPRGFTIGEDTACCMTIDGMSKSCIKAGYKRENAGFLGVYEPSGDLLAQSFWYVHPNNPDVLVLDNIEANKGRNFSKLVNLYQKLIEQYLFDHPDLAIKEVRVGTGYSDVDLGDLKDVTSPDVLDGVYTDAYRQKVLWRKSS